MLVGWNCTAKYESIVYFVYQIYITIILLLIPLIMMIGLYGNIIVTLISGDNNDDEKNTLCCWLSNRIPKKKITDGIR